MPSSNPNLGYLQILFLGFSYFEFGSNKNLNFV